MEVLDSFRVSTFPIVRSWQLYIAQDQVDLWFKWKPGFPRPSLEHGGSAWRLPASNI